MPQKQNASKRNFSVVVPLVVYFVAEWLLGTWWAIGLSVIFPLIELARHTCSWKEAAGEVAFLVVFGLVDMLDYRELVVPACLALVFALELSGKFSLFRLYGGERYRQAQANPYTRLMLRQTMARMLFWSVVSFAVYGIAYMQAGTPLSDYINNWWLLTVLLAYVATEMVLFRVRYVKYRKCEWVPLVDEEGKGVGTAPRPLVHNGSHWLHPVVHLHVVDRGKLLLQLRPKSKETQPGKWDTAVGGHISVGEKLEDALRREAWEEIGIREFKARLMRQYHWHCEVEDELVLSFMTEHKGPFRTMNEGEVDELRFWTIEELKNSIGKGIFTPNLEEELNEWIMTELSKK